MNESDYIIISNATKLKIALEIIKDILPVDKVNIQMELFNTKRALEKATNKYNKYLDEKVK